MFMDLNIKNMRKFREKWAKEAGEQSNIDKIVKYVGSKYVDNNNTIQKGFFSVVYGDKDDISNFLKTILNIEKISNIIYELMQNANDAKANKLLIAYNGP